MFLFIEHGVDVNFSILGCAHNFDYLPLIANGLVFVTTFFELSFSVSKIVVLLTADDNIRGFELDCTITSLERVLSSEIEQLFGNFDLDQGPHFIK